MKHYSLVELDMYRDGHMSVLRRINCGSHLQHCKKCAEKMKQLEEDDKFLAQLRSSIQTFEALSKEEAELEKKTAESEVQR